MSHHHEPVIQPPNPLKGASKVARIPIKVEAPVRPLPKPDWIRARSPNHPEVLRLKAVLRQQRLHTVCEEAACPNLGECFAHGTATFMVMGNLCTRRCPFCDVAHGRPAPLDREEPHHLAATVRAMGLNFVVITSVDRDDLRDGGAGHFAACIAALRHTSPTTHIEILTPDFRGREALALATLAAEPPDIFNHNLETVPRLYPQVRPGASYAGSLELLQNVKERCPSLPTKSGLMVGLGETRDEIIEVMHDLRRHHVDNLTIGQYLSPSRHHLPVIRYITPAEFEEYAHLARELGFTHVAAGPMVRSSYHAELQAKGEHIS
jgi:lipoic acid synthetase